MPPEAASAALAPLAAAAALAAAGGTGCGSAVKPAAISTGWVVSPTTGALTGAVAEAAAATAVASLTGFWRSTR